MSIFQNYSVVILCMAAICAQISVAAEPPPRTIEFVSESIRLYKGQDYQQSLLLVTQALMVNVESQRGLQHLKTLRNEKNLPTRQRRKIERALELLDYIQFLKKRTEALKQKNEELKEAVRRFGGSYEALTKTISVLGSDETNQRAIEKLHSQYVNRVMTKQSTGLEDLIGMVSQMKDLHVKVMTSTQIINDRLNGINFKVMRVIDAKPAGPDEVVPATPAPVNKDDAELNQFRNNLNMLNRSLLSLTKDVQRSENRVNGLTQELTTKTLELFEKEDFISQQKQDFEDLQNELNDARERLHLIQRIIREKDQTINSLEDHMQKIQFESNARNKISENQLKSLELTMSLLQGKIDAQKQLGAEQLRSLEQMIADQEKRIASYTNAIREKDNGLENLRTELLTKDKTLGQLKDIVQSKDEKLIQLDGIIEIYKGKLFDAYSDGHRQADRVKQMEGQLGQLEADLDQSHREARELYNKIMKLESHFSKVREKTFNNPGEVQ